MIEAWPEIRLGQSRRFHDVGGMPGLPPIAAVWSLNASAAERTRAVTDDCFRTLDKVREGARLCITPGSNQYKNQFGLWEVSLTDNPVPRIPVRIASAPSINDDLPSSNPSGKAMLIVLSCAVAIVSDLLGSHATFGF